jgi:hypothetical protein
MRDRGAEWSEVRRVLMIRKEREAKWNIRWRGNVMVRY